jgi:arsenate reductase
VSNSTSLVCTLYHNPRCSKSRATLALLHEHGVEPTIVDYLLHPPNASELKSLLKKLRIGAEELMRKNEHVYEAKISGKSLTEAQMVAAMVDNPILIERPIVVIGNRAVIGRPPENVLQLLK